MKPIDEEREAELKYLLTANLAKTVKKVASTSENLKGAYKRFLRDAAGKAGVCVTEISKKNSYVGSETILKQENIQLKTCIQELEAKCTKLESSDKRMLFSQM